MGQQCARVCVRDLHVYAAAGCHALVVSTWDGLRPQ